MCFEARKTVKARIAEKDIICYKIIRSDNTPWYSGTHHCTTPYKINGDNIKVKITPISSPEYESSININKGYHSYITRNGATNNWSYLMNNSKEMKISRFIIPVGTIYYRNRKEYVSETIKLIE